ncbi:MAG: hypothetical protein CM15mP12_1840 [Gammaproteobacteria bacterium]|nr:MAG: hypothetical protein CM15mP12_1840 [Gammaproteobacteria bacterium]
MIAELMNLTGNSLRENRMLLAVAEQKKTIVSLFLLERTLWTIILQQINQSPCPSKLSNSSAPCNTCQWVFSDSCRNAC